MSRIPLTDWPDVPARYRGVWRRTLLETPDLRDESTWVHWLQTARWHADLRVSTAAEVGRSPVPLEALSAVQRAALAQQQGFFGRTEVQHRAHGDLCTWHRLHDLQPPGTSPDVGWMEFETTERVLETGVHGPYREVWERVPGSQGPCFVLASLPDPGEAGTRAFLLRAGDWLMRVRPRRAVWPAGLPRGRTLASCVVDEPGAAVGLLDFEISHGVHRDGAFAIERSSLPQQEGGIEAMRIERTRADTATVVTDVGASDWQVLEWGQTDDVC